MIGSVTAAVAPRPGTFRRVERHVEQVEGGVGASALTKWFP